MIGRTISHYTILEKLGEGGMGVVYKAQDTKLRRTVALKFLPPALLATDDDRRRFVHEAQASAALSHANIATVFEIDDSAPQTFIALEYVEGHSLTEKIKSGPLKIDDALSIAIQLSEGLNAAHQKGIVHRDVKSQNVMVTPAGQVKILDFGLAKLRGATVVTKAGTTVGTMGYMSPEQLRGEAVDVRTDIWSVGVVLYEMIAGRRPFQGDYEDAVAYQVLNQQPEPLTAIRTGVPMELERIVKKLLSKSVTERYQTTTDLLVDLRVLKRTSESGVTSTFTTGAAARRQWFVPAAGVFLFLAVIVGLLVIFKPLASTHDIRTIAVLPLKNLSSAADQEYVAEGMQIALINELSKIRSLTIISSQSSSRFKNSDKSAREIAAALSVDGLLSGSTLLDGNTIRVSLQLTDGGSDKTIWSDQYDKAYRNILALHSEIARDVTTKIKADLTPEERQTLSEKQQVDPKTYEAFQRGLLLTKQGNPRNVEKAIKYFEEALALDPHFAPAVAWLSTMYMQLGTVALPPSERAARKEAVAKCRELALRALELDPTSSEAHRAMGAYYRQIEWNLTESEKEFREAERLNPGDAQIQSGYSNTLSLLGRYDEALKKAQRAQTLDPLSSIRSQYVASVLFVADRIDDAIAQQKKTLELDSRSMSAWMFMGELYQAKGLSREGMLAWARAHELDGNAELAKAYRELPMKDAILRWLAQSQGPRGPVFNNPAVAAYANELIGNRAEALRLLEKALSDHDASLLGFLTAPGWKELRSDPRGKSIIQRMGVK